MTLRTWIEDWSFCTTCGAKPGDSCRTKTGNPCWPHAPRSQQTGDLFRWDTEVTA